MELPFVVDEDTVAKFHCPDGMGALHVMRPENRRLTICKVEFEREDIEFAKRLIRSLQQMNCHISASVHCFEGEPFRNPSEAQAFYRSLDFRIDQKYPDGMDWRPLKVVKS